MRDAPLTLSVIIPIGPDEDRWQTVVKQVAQYEEIYEIILSGTDSFLPSTEGFPENLRALRGESGRAKQLNLGAKNASGEFLWFVHADSELDERSVRLLLTSLRASPRALYYFDLIFRDDGPSLVFLNQLGAWIRSRIFGIPFGDQAFCLKKELFSKLGGFDENAPIAEDHLFVWAAKRAKVPIIATGGSIRTSARKYKKHGWLSVTTQHIFITLSQVLSELRKGRNSSLSE